MKSYTPFRYPGGKAKLYKYFSRIIKENVLTGCTYIEPFCGGAGLAMKLLFQGDVNNIIINDLDRAIYSVWYTIINNCPEFCEVIRKIEITIEERRRLKEIYKDKENADLFQLSVATLFLNRVNRSGIINAGVIGGKDQSGKDKMDCRFNKDDLIKKIKAISEKNKYIKVFNMEAIDFLNMIKRDNQTDSLIYLDPPYYNQGSSLYANCFNHNHHEILRDNIYNLNGYNWVLTYDDTPEIRELYEEFNPKQYDISYTVERKRVGSELLMSNLDVDFSN